jgi:hypothetical protein
VRCFQKLVKSHFLANVSAELSLARQTVQKMNEAQPTPTLFLRKKERRAEYADVVRFYSLLEGMADTLASEMDKKSIYYCLVDQYVFVYSKNKSQLREAIMYSHNLNGDVCVYTTRHRVLGHVVYTALINTQMCFTPSSPN